jgi:hypothetical protein
VTTRLLGNSWTTELHRRLNNCKKKLSKEQAELILEIINLDEFNALPQIGAEAGEPPKLQ